MVIFLSDTQNTIFDFWRHALSTDLNIHIYKQGKITIVYCGNMTSMNIIIS